MKKTTLLYLLALIFATSMSAQGVKPLPTLHVDGKWFVDEHGNHVVLHGVMDTPNMYFNGWRWGSPWDGTGTGYNSNSVSKCLNYFEKLFTGLEQAKCNIFRLHLDPAWTNDPSDSYVYPGSEGQGDDAVEEADIKKFNPTRLRTFMTSLYWPLMQKAMNHGMFVVVRPPGVCPPTIKVGDYYQQYLLTVWDIVTQNTNILKYAGQISIELANEPVAVKNANGQDDPKALHDFFQPIVDKIRSNGFTGIILAPGSSWQANYTGYASNPIEGYNIAYAVHDYPGWYGGSDSSYDPAAYIAQFKAQVPVVETSPIIITEVDWSPEDPNGEGHYDEHGNWVLPNLGTWGTGSTSKWGQAFKALLDHYENISMTLTHPHEFIDIDRLLADGTVTAAFNGNPEACGQACMDWYADYYDVNWAHADFSKISVSDQGTGTYKNPVIFGDYPDPDVVRVGDTYYFASTTMHNFPGCTLLKSKDLVNWEYCSQPLDQLSSNDNYNLQNGQNAYSKGMWACAIAYNKGKFYILINGNDAGGFLLTASDPEGPWEKKKLDRIYYDPGMLFDGDKVYIVCGINKITICQLDRNFNFESSQVVIEREGTGLEGSHLYKIGDYYYIYSTYGGYPTGQTIFRSQNIWGPYEEKQLLDKYINGKANTVHQGALIDTPDGGEWWTLLMEDLGPMGRMPNLQPVTWSDGWPVIGNNGVPYTSHAKPNTGTYTPRKALPTNDNFRSYPINMQWEWNHNPDNGAWSLFERPGWLRMKTSGSADRLTQARNMLTQRIFAYHDKTTTPSTGTVCIDVSGLEEGDRAGICILQDPYAAIAVEMKDGQKRLVWWQDQYTDNEGFTPAEVTQAVDITDNVIYLRASITYGTGKTKFFYSLDNKTFTAFGEQTDMEYNLSIFVGTRFGIFCYNTQDGSEGYADFDWFSTETNFDESKYYPDDYEGYSEDMLTMTKLVVAKSKMEVMVGSNVPVKMTATYLDGHTEDVSAKARYTVSAEGIVNINSGFIRGLAEGAIKVDYSYTDPMGNTLGGTLDVNSTFFPFAKEHINTSLFGEGTYYEATHMFTTGQYGQMGWVYDNGADMSGYKYLVIKLKRRVAEAHLNIFTENNIWGNGYSTPNFGTDLTVVVNLDDIKYTTGSKTGQPFDTKNVRIVSFWADRASITVKEMYLTNNDDYSREDLTSVEELSADIVTDNTPVGIWSLSGVPLPELRPGINIVRTADGKTKKIYVE